ncbi:hypothetical protein BJ508DRAFT_413089 [Ascobolus immersus RN42]|uniref:Uncharacterized protein n=1 Tax=Ascobolus immersus RN42 TaxID=1160509 RepID=A0A3N4ID81_ASCIM|nr:hypothetical protein BJ508DRAFT_413089 [Ascobolus immersus RN42]
MFSATGSLFHHTPTKPQHVRPQVRLFQPPLQLPSPSPSPTFSIPDFEPPETSNSLPLSSPTNSGPPETQSPPLASPRDNGRKRKHHHHRSSDEHTPPSFSSCSDDDYSDTDAEMETRKRSRPATEAEARKRRQSTKRRHESAIARTIETTNLLFEHIRRTLPQLTNVKTAADVHLTPTRNEKLRELGYDWKLSGGYKFPRRIKQGSLKVIFAYRTVEHDEMRKALEDGRLTAVATEGVERKEDEEMGEVYEHQDDSESDSEEDISDSEIIAKQIMPASTPITEPEPESEPITVQQPDQDLSSLLQTSTNLLLTHLHTTHPSLGHITPTDLLLPQTNARLPYHWQCTNNYSLPLLNPVNKRIKPLSRFTSSEHLSLHHALSTGSLKAVLKQSPTSVPSSSESEESEYNSSDSERPRKRHRQHPPSKPAKRTPVEELISQTTKLLHQHIQTTLPSLRRLTLDEITLSPWKLAKDHLPYRWKHRSPYTFPTLHDNNGTTRLKRMNLWTPLEHASLRTALETGDLQAILAEDDDDSASDSSSASEKIVVQPRIKRQPARSASPSSPSDDDDLTADSRDRLFRSIRRHLPTLSVKPNDITISPWALDRTFSPYRWHFSGSYSFPTTTSIHQHGVQKKVKSLERFTPEEHRALRAALKRGELLPVLAENVKTVEKERSTSGQRVREAEKDRPRLREVEKGARIRESAREGGKDARIRDLEKRNRELEKQLKHTQRLLEEVLTQQKNPAPEPEVESEEEEEEEYEEEEEESDPEEEGVLLQKTFRFPAGSGYRALVMEGMLGADGVVRFGFRTGNLRRHCEVRLARVGELF